MGWTRATGAVALAVACVLAQAGMSAEDSGGRQGIDAPP